MRLERDIVAVLLLAEGVPAMLLPETLHVYGCGSEILGHYGDGDFFDAKLEMNS